MLNSRNADMAQLVEQRIRNAWVGGSSPPIGSFPKVCGSSSVGRASASQAEGHEFEPRLPLKVENQEVKLKNLLIFYHFYNKI